MIEQLLSRRGALKKLASGLLVPAFGIFVPELIRAQSVVPNRRRNFQPASGGGGCATLGDSNTASSSASDPIFKFSNYFAWQFTATSSYTVCSIILKFSKSGTVANNFDVSIYSDNSNVPGSISGTGSGNIAQSSVNDSFAETIITGTLSAPVTAAAYWIVLHSANTDSTNYLTVRCTAFSGGLSKYSDNGTSWNALDNQPLYFKLSHP